jgi:hypothetical protein
MADQSQNPGRKGRLYENEGDGDRFFDAFRYTPYSSDQDFFRDPIIYEANELSRSVRNAVDKGDSQSDHKSR